jgi:hypothetical protein
MIGIPIELDQVIWSPERKTPEILTDEISHDQSRITGHLLDVNQTIS